MSSEWKARRFWKAASVREVEGGAEVTLDERPVRTPGKLPLILPTVALAKAIAAEWDAQIEIIDPNTMPLTRAANSAVERVTPQFDAVANMLADYGGTDLLSYRAVEPERLVHAQAEGWDPLVDWAATRLKAPLRITHGVIPIAQDDSVLHNLRAEVMGLDAFGLTALHDLVTLPGSLILGLAVIRGRLNAADSHALSRIDEEFQSESWGRDDEADEAAAARLTQMNNAERFWSLSRTV
ncbi:ATP12 family chaperone protein [Paracoccus aestuariivivens]|uniref:ATPase n=1 Tax=Paracoccus aestuariivivens TaxID=1820333 RepID=A0A6L6J759_9RHOB|nr:ATP12 family protein [Paracoccus aestuariivivens]MTH77780.1 ATPase [Paracoccus aestuariivivens]